MNSGKRIVASTPDKSTPVTMRYTRPAAIDTTKGGILRKSLADIKNARIMMAAGTMAPSSGLTIFNPKLNNMPPTMPITMGMGIKRITMPITPVRPATSEIAPAIKLAPSAASSPTTGITAANISAPGIELAIGSGSR